MGSDIQNLLRELPSVDKLLRLPVTVDVMGRYGRLLTTEALRYIIEQTRNQILAGATYVPAPAILVDSASKWLDDLLAPTLLPVINATGVIVHTNLGRAPLSEGAIAAITAVAHSYSTLEYDPVAGQRGSRTVHAEQLLRRLTGAEAALVVNNAAAAVLLMLTSLCQGREVIISRGQLVEIGGGFRIPDVMAQSGAKLVEVGTTNRTHLRDYAAAINENTAAILVAHHSNYKIIGFTSEPTLTELAELAHEHNLPLLYDQGSGALLDVGQFGLEPEPTVGEGLAAGGDVLAFSGDKLLGGPQAGILCGRADLIAQLKRHPLARAVRADKLCLAGLVATLTSYTTEKALQEIPVWQMMARPFTELAETADTWAARWQEQGIKASVIDGESTVGGGSLPGTSLPTRLIAIDDADVEGLAAALRQHRPVVVGRIQDGRYPPRSAHHFTPSGRTIDYSSSIEIWNKTMTISGPRLRTLLRQAERTAEAGKRAAAQQIYEQILEEDKTAEEAWLGLANLVSNEAEKKQLYAHVLTLNPDNKVALHELALLRGEIVSEPEPIMEEKAAEAEPEPEPESHEHEVAEEEYELACYRHPNRPTSLRCYTCGKPICTQCAVKTPVGYRCPDCVRDLENTFFEATLRDYVLVTAVLFPISLIIGIIVTYFIGRSFFLLFFMFAIGGAIGSAIGRVGHRVAGRRRGRYMPIIAATCIVLGVLLPAAFVLLTQGRLPGLAAGIYLFVATSAAYYQMR